MYEQSRSMVPAKGIDQAARDRHPFAAQQESPSRNAAQRHLQALMGAGSARVVRRPHYRLDGSALFFMASKRPHCQLSPLELDIWRAAEQPVTLSALRERFSAGADEVVKEFWRRELCEVVEDDFARARRRVLVIEPHPDDAALGRLRDLAPA